MSGLLSLIFTLPALAQEDTAAEVSAEPEAPIAEPLTPAAGSVSEIQIQGLKRVEEAAIMAAVGLRPGEQLAPWKIKRDIKSVYNTGYVDDVRVTIERADDGVVVVFTVDEKPAIRSVRLAGNKKLDEDALMEVIDML